MTFAHRIRAAVLYTGLALMATPALADRDQAALESVRAGDMLKLVFAEPAPAPDPGFVDVEDKPLNFADTNGKLRLVNFWATWCAPCRHEMPALNALQKEFGGETFEVITIATGRNPVPAMKKFFAEAEVDVLPLHRDPKQSLARAMSVFGLPTTLVLDEEGREIARLRGDAAWYSDEAREMIRALLDAS